MLWVSGKSFGESFRHAFAQGLCSAAAACTLCSGCFLDDSPRTAGSSSSSSGAAQGDAGPKRGFVPRDPGPVRSQNVDAGVAQSSSVHPTGPTTVADASMPSVTAKPTVPTTVTDAQVAPAADAQVAPPVDAQVTAAADAATAAIGDAQVAPVQDAAAQAPDATMPPSAALPQPIHRYEFEGSARVALDSIGDAHAELQGRAYLGGMGEVQLGGMYEDAVVLPPRILADVKSFTMLGWMVPRSEECTQRLFEFIYYREGGNGQRGAQVSALYLAPYACPDELPAVGYLTERMVYNVVGTQPLSGPREQVLLGAMYDADTEELQLIVNGVVEQRMIVPLQRRELALAQGSLGRSSPEGQSPFGSSIAEFRIYDQVLEPATLAEIARRGPDQL